MKQTNHRHDTDVIDHVMAEYLLSATVAKSKIQKIKNAMECRRKLEIKKEEQRLARAISEFDFN